LGKQQLFLMLFQPFAGQALGFGTATSLKKNRLSSCNGAGITTPKPGGTGRRFDTSQNCDASKKRSQDECDRHRLDYVREGAPSARICMALALGNSVEPDRSSASHVIL
jgi:hypothetical protein